MKLTALFLLLTAFIAVNAAGIPEDPVNIAEEVEEDRDDFDEEDEEDRDDIDEIDEDEEDEDEEDRNELIDENVEDRVEITEGCIRVGAKANGKHMNTGSLRTNSALACQKLCEALDGCEFFRWRDQDLKAKWKLRRRCYLMKERKDVKKRIEWSWGPKMC